MIISMGTFFLSLLLGVAIVHSRLRVVWRCFSKRSSQYNR